MTNLRDNLVAFLGVRGWTPPSMVGPLGSLWARPESDWMLPVPHVLDPSSADWPLILERLAAVEGMEPADIERRITFASIDVINLRGAEFEDATDSISLRAGASMAMEGWRMLRACATTATGPKAAIKGNYRAQGEMIVQAARMAHTKPGSYIIPVHVSLTDPIEMVEQALPQGDRVLPDCPERRFTRTVLNVMNTLDKVVIRPEKSPSKDGLHELIAAGTSKEFTSSLAKILTTEGVRSFSTEFEWAIAAGAPSTSGADPVVVPAAASKLVDEVAFRLGAIDEQTVPETLTGTVVGVYRPDDDLGEVTIATYRSGRPCHVTVNVTASVLEQALDWMKRKDTVMTKGTVRRSGSGLVADGLDNVRLLGGSSLFD